MVPVVFTSAAAGILTWLLCRDEGRKADRIGFALITAGGLSNLYDRLKRGYVVDYFSIRCKYLEKVVFNLGDFFIFAGSALIAAFDLLGAVRDLSSPAEDHIKRSDCRGERRMRRNDIVDSKDIVHLIENVKGILQQVQGWRENRSTTSGGGPG